ncbi:hypothetical protein BT96DRAFT_1017805 [Gymnopus androsaceus JB14]|uniref:HAT C-terminal dimerisation domain-containing protein n=1 Tax=Gymnopus androsaceus JB14 TaxID=1447944 RepID=A0A6A4HW05_9AGAR|nr:hypothetical protein BT96DRAFT_1017805 [Gymnopus androsaceus JB14]
MILHPSFKLEYFKRLQWPQGWISDAIDIACKAWEGQYKPKESSTLDLPTEKPVAGSSSNIFVSLMSTQTKAAFSNNNATDQFNRYLADSCVQTDDPLQWWVMN